MAPIPVSLHRGDWSLHRTGSVDQARHNEKVKQAIRENLADIVSEEAIITSDGKRAVKVPIRSLDLPHFRFDPGRQKHTGQGTGGSKVGDVIGQLPQQGSGRQAGDQPGVDYYEADVTIDELAEMIFEDLGLPNLQQKGSQEIESEQIRLSDIARHGSMSNLDKRRTVLQNMRRNAIASGKARFAGIKTDDLRFRAWSREVRREMNAVVFAMRDVSGSMGEFEKYITRSFYFWMVRFLRAKYTTVKIVFITHHAEAQEVDEEAFFNLGESGGTMVSTAYNLALNIISERYDPQYWNIYPFHFSDGDNWGDKDNELCVDLVHKLIGMSGIFGYGEIREGRRRQESTLMSAFKRIDDPRFVGVTITDKTEVYPALRAFFSMDPKDARAPIAEGM